MAREGKAVKVEEPSAEGGKAGEASSKIRVEAAKVDKARQVVR